MNRFRVLWQGIQEGFTALSRQPQVLAAMLWRRIVLRRTTVIAITGSVGKSTAADCLASILSLLGPTHQGRGRNGRGGLSETILTARPSHRFLVLEVGILRPGRMWRGAILTRPDAAVIMAVNWQHARSFESLDQIAAEKAKLLNGLRPGGLAALNADDARVAAMRPGPGRRTVTFGLRDGAQVKGRIEASVWPQRLSLHVEDAGGSQRIPSQLVGPHWAPSVLAAVAVARALGASWEQCAEGVARNPPHVSRLQPVTLPSGAVLLRDEYNGSWATLDKALELLQQAVASRKVVILGNIRDAPHLGSDPAAEIGRRTARVAELLMLWGSNAEVMRRAALQERPGLPVRTFQTQSELAAALRTEARDGDLILLKGYWSDHMSRIAFEQFGTVGCKRSYCRVTSECERCARLKFVPENGADARLLDQLLYWNGSKAPEPPVTARPA